MKKRKPHTSQTEPTQHFATEAHPGTSQRNWRDSTRQDISQFIFFGKLCAATDAFLVRVSDSRPLSRQTLLLREKLQIAQTGVSRSSSCVDSEPPPSFKLDAPLSKVVPPSVYVFLCESCSVLNSCLKRQHLSCRETLEMVSLLWTTQLDAVCVSRTSGKDSPIYVLIPARQHGT